MRVCVCVCVWVCVIHHKQRMLGMGRIKHRASVSRWSGQTTAASHSVGVRRQNSVSQLVSLVYVSNDHDGEEPCYQSSAFAGNGPAVMPICKLLFIIIIQVFPIFKGSGQIQFKCKLICFFISGDILNDFLVISKYYSTISLKDTEAKKVMEYLPHVLAICRGWHFYCMSYH